MSLDEVLRKVEAEARSRGGAREPAQPRPPVHAVPPPEPPAEVKQAPSKSARRDSDLQQIAAAIPDSGYIAEYVAFGSRVTMAPPEFHLAGALAQLSTVMGNRVRFDLGGTENPPHLWLVLLGRAGLAKKSSACNLAARMLDEATGNQYRLAQESTREALWSALQDRPEGYVVWSEFAGMLARSQLSYMSGQKDDLNEFFDSAPERSRKLQSATYTVKQPALTILGATVVDALSDWVTRGDLAQGFLSRFLLVPQVSDVAYIGMLRPDRTGREGLVAQLRALSKKVPLATSKPRILTFPEPAREAWEAYDRPMHDESRTVPAELSGFLGRGGLYAAKLSLCYALAAGRIEPAPEDVAHAVAFVRFSHEQVRRLAESDLGRTDKERRMGLVEKWLEAHAKSWTPKREVYRALHMVKDEMEAHLRSLIEAGRIEQHEVSTGGRYRGEVRWIEDED